MRNLPYQEGDWFAVPLADGGFGIGLAARMSGDGVVLGYFFGPRRSVLPELPELSKLGPEDAIMVLNFGDLGFLRKEWPILGRLENWDRRAWPMPVFGRFEELSGRAWKVEYADDNPNSRPRESKISLAELKLLPGDGLYGWKAVEKVLTGRLRPGK